MPRVAVSIGRLRLRGMPASDQARLVDALKAALASQAGRDPTALARRGAGQAVARSIRLRARSATKESGVGDV